MPSISGPKRPQDRIELTDAKNQFAKDIHNYAAPGEESKSAPVSTGDGRNFELANGAVAIASITSCTNTSNPSVMLAAGLLARNARKRGLNSKPWVKTSIAPGSKVVTDYYTKAGLIEDLERSTSSSSATAARPASATPVPSTRRSPSPSRTTTSR